MAVVVTSGKHQELVEELLADVTAYNPGADTDLIARAFAFAERAHEGQTRRSGQDFIHHPFSVAKICAGLHLDDATIVAALLHDVVEDTDTALEEVRSEFGDEVARLVDGVTKLTRVKFQTREQAEAENYRKMIVAMAEDVRVILIKLADRLHNLRTIEYLGKQKQVQKAKEALEVYAPLAHRLGIHALKWELEDLAFQALHPRKYEEIKRMVAERRADREDHVHKAGEILHAELGKLDIPAEISGRAKHFYSIYEKMAKRGREFNEIYDLNAMRVTVERDDEEGTRDCYGALGLIHSLWKPMPGRFKDYIAMPKFNRYRSLHTTVIGPEGKPLEIQIRTRAMHTEAELGVAAHWAYKRGDAKADAEWRSWVEALMDEHRDEADPGEFLRGVRTDLFSHEVYVFTPKGEVKTLPAGATPIDFAYAIHTDVGHRTVGAKVNGRIVPLHYKLRSGDFVEILAAKSETKGPSRDWLSLVASTRARNKIRQWFSRETREDTEQRGREILEQALKAQNLPYRKLAGSALMAQVIRELGFRKAEDFYLALGSGRLTPSQIVKKVLQRLKTDEVAQEETIPRKAPRARTAVASDTYGIRVEGVDDVLVRLAKCCTPVPGDPICGYISLGRGITIHREDCPNVKALRRNPERFTNVAWDGGTTSSFLVQIRVDSWDRPRLLEDVARTFAEHGANIVEYGGHVEDQLAKNWYTAEVGDVKDLRGLLSALRNIESVFDAYRVTPS
ncbi:MAG TPA: bifunctional (p)ppGpp synthetase/guanosine-3',5'-bis(diphosphate) 3'-pyrophosphohydrolase [Gaiellaceae bacterium]|jgi:GTP pyrophosphokinase|nr:bifunctional (p)ppGpp synthetase/guanosine-3',5'-bis(diphosphate) 3'-pyrophosphohydrolase [Gaiellaceae bacterium]